MNNLYRKIVIAAATGASFKRLSFAGIVYASYRKPIYAPSSTEWELWNTGLLKSTVYREEPYAVKVS